MKYAITLFLAILISAGTQTGVKAQQINRERMNHDIIISKNILKELFNTKWSADGSNVKVISGSFSVGQFNAVRGLYIPGYGVLFSIPGGPPAFVTQTNAKDNATSYKFAGNGEKVNTASIIDRMEEFLRDYGPSIGQLKNNDRLTVIYMTTRSNTYNFTNIYLGNTKQNDHKKQQLTSIKVSIKMKDLKNYQRGKLSKDDLNGRFEISKDNSKGTAHKDLKIMRRIFETAFEDASSHIYHISGAEYTYVDKLGAIFYLVGSYGTGFDTIKTTLGDIHDEMIKIINADSVKEKVISADSLALQKPQIDSGVVSKINVSYNGHQTNTSKEAEKAYHDFLKKLKRTMVNYGRTLRSVQTDEQIYVALSLTNSNDKIPDRVDLRLKKSVLKALDKGQISRKKAIKQIKVRMVKEFGK